jgi:diacylglycerol kinase family enzyme
VYAAAALLAGAVTVALAVAAAASQFPRGLIALACAGVAIAASLFGLARRGKARAIALALAVALIAAATVVLVADDSALGVLAAAGALLTLAAAAAAFEVRVALHPAPRPQRPVLVYNPLSGGGKAARLDLAAQAHARGIEAIELSHGADLRVLVDEALARGADALAMAGGDGSQAVVAAAAAEHALPYACIPAGTRNHFARDLGVDRDDVVGALDALVDGGERLVDLAEVNGRVFVNNVSLGLYAEAVQQPGYREAKLHTLLETVPDSVGPDAKPPDLVWDSPEGKQSAVAILISNNAYRLGRVLGSGTRPRLDDAVLGVTVLAPSKSAADGAVRRRVGMQQWITPTFEITSGSKVAAGIDGEATYLDPPLRFRTRPGELRVRIAPQHPGASPSALEPDQPWRGVRALVSLLIHGAPTDARQVP